MMAPLRAATPEKEKIVHPPYVTMISSAIAELKDKKGSTKPAIVNKIVANTGLDSKIAGRYVGKALKKGLEDGTFVQADGTGLRGRFVLPGSNVLVKKQKKTQGAIMSSATDLAKVKAGLPTRSPKRAPAKKTAKASTPKKAAKISAPKKAAAKVSTPKKAAAKAPKKTPTPKKIGKGKTAKKAAVAAAPAVLPVVAAQAAD